MTRLLAGYLMQAAEVKEWFLTGLGLVRGRLADRLDDTST